MLQFLLVSPSWVSLPVARMPNILIIEIHQNVVNLARACFINILYKSGDSIKYKTRKEGEII